MKTLYILFFALVAFSLSARTVTFDEPRSINDPKPAVDFVSAGDWTIEPKINKWTKFERTLYPDKTVAIPAGVQRNMADTLDELDEYLKIAFRVGKVSSSPRGLVLTDITSIDWFGVCIDQTGACKFLFIHTNNHEYALRPFLNMDDETTAAISLRASITANLALIGQDVKTNKRHE